ncbi:aldo/keto reductase [Nocardioides endophyticus]|uniref:Aldo/keto reductase n=1 Tax=Nocardioides endophyticus TaxID=1353775 RepID=A0ABP8YGD4_9ACTN
MEYNALGSSGLMVSALALGTMTFGVETDETQAVAMLDQFVEQGGTLIDTADVYGEGAAEQIIGRWLRNVPQSCRDGLVLTTKGRFRTGADANAEGLSRRHLTRALETSLRRLDQEHVDLYQLHAWDDLVPLEETLEFARDAVARGLIGYLGVSNFHGWQVQRASDLADLGHHLRIVSNQVQYNLMSREVELEIVPACLRSGIGLLAWSPLAGGWLTGKYRNDETPGTTTRMGQDLPPWLAPMRRAASRGVEAYQRRAGDSQTWELLRVLQDVATEVGASQTAVSLRWLTSRPAVASVIVGARHADQLQQSMATTDCALDPTHLEALDRAWAPTYGDYPYGPIGQNTTRRSISTTH